MTGRRAFASFTVAMAIALVVVSLPQVAGAEDATSPLLQIRRLLTSFGDVSRSWSAALPADQRFVVLGAFNDEAVLDRNTGLVWQKALTLTYTPWAATRSKCINATIGGQKGWRLPSASELASLIDPANQSPALPAGSPFDVNTGSPNFWSATSLADDPERAWYVNFNTGLVDAVDKTFYTFHTRCVRGAMTADQY